ncbi:helix-turn-helix transcriptional regulator [uncultured Psychroserpens sp.]|uniref:helix-turn-helix domain-containing protein n=1 Tax=uncultured Psychroserpens sp. TaxID=255436 RepID=UPI002608FF7E|nr:helix-turn-helix transcriptional regulator [uncultured Psychroserpens sp.]
MQINKRLINFIRLVFLQLIFTIASFNCNSQSASKNEQSIKGKLQLDSVWEPVVYLSHIPTFKDMYTMSNEMIIAESKIDSFGNFHFSSKALPINDNLYRIHVSKKEAPAASLIIGGKEENHIFFIANQNTQIFITNTSSDSLFNKHSINGYLPNYDLKIINDIIYKSEHAKTNYGALKKEFVTKTIHEQLRHIADTSSHPIVSLYALNNSKFESTFLENQKFYENYLIKWEHEDSAYFKELRVKFPKEDNKSIFRFIVIGIFFFLFGFVINYFFGVKRRKSNNLLKSLSIQERKIFSLLKDGKSNKEISDELNIGLSTVKSHASNIYAKLGIKSRKEILDINL